MSMAFGDENQGLVLFESSPVRRVWHEGRWFYSVIDIVDVLAKSENPRQYWYDMKRRIKDEGFIEVSAMCLQFKLRAPDGRMRETDCGDVETVLRIIQSIPSPKAEPFKRWLAGLGAEVIDDRAEDQRRIDYRQPKADVHKDLHAEIHQRGVQRRVDHAEFDARGHIVLYNGESIQETEERRDIPPGELHSWMGSEEMGDTIFRDVQSRAYIKRMNIQGKEPVMQAHEQVSEAVRTFIIDDLGGTPPEQLPKADKSLEQIEKDAERRRTKGLDLFPPEEIAQTEQPKLPKPKKPQVTKGKSE